MKLKPDLIRDILLFAESLDYQETVSNKDIFTSPFLNKYKPEEIAYAVDRLGPNEAGFINGGTRSNGYTISILSLRYKGHQYLDDIRDDGIWKDTKSKISVLASVSVPVIQEVAKAITLKKLGF
ncbi:DUF2513 domain-containing protein [Enterococcus thailandicus]|uniref:DUF2513 domain-containing protein n=1 Tax=Enterococcus thailandicus TaxID=417368 RepID=UPI0032E51496